MSLGISGKCVIELEDEHTAIYSYAGWDSWLYEGNHDINPRMPGHFTIQKSCLEEPEIHSRIRRTPSGRKKLVEKKIIHYPDISAHLESGGVIIDELCGVDLLYARIYRARYPQIALTLIAKLFMEYMETGELPGKMGFAK